MDIKVGNGTFMKTLSEAKKLSVRLKKISQAFNIKLDVTYSNMSQPLGKYAGLRCEIIEAIDCLKGNTHNELVELSIELCTKILLQSGVCKNKSEARIRLLQNIENGSALKKFEDMIIAQNGDLKYLYSENRIARNVLIVKSKKKGFIKSIDTEKIGWALVEMGCGRKVSSDHLDFKAGIKFNYKIGDLIYKDDPICELFCSDKIKIENASKIIEKSFLIDEHEVKKPKLILN
jgi:pyrimidine-nucleoside phosphorylase